VIIDDHTTALITVDEPAGAGQTDDTAPVHGLSKLLGSLQLSFADLDPNQHGPTWHDPIAPYGKPVSDLVMTQSDGKRFWRFLRRKDPPPEVVIIAANGGIALSLTFAVCDQLHIPRAGTIYTVDGDPDAEYKGEAPNKHVYSCVRESRALVV
jgi:hypothetical protein